MGNSKLHSLFPRLRNIVLILFIMNIVIQVTSVFAVTTDIIMFDSSLFKARISAIGYGDQNKVYTLDPEEGTVTFSDGEVGAIPPVPSGGMIASYCRDGDISCNVSERIFKQSNIPTDFSPFFLPVDFFPVNHGGKIDYSFVVSGLTSLGFEITGNGMEITDVNSVPEPGTMLLLVSGLGGLLLKLGRNKFKKTKGG